MSGGICFAPLYGQVTVNDMSWKGLKFPESCCKMCGLSWDLLLLWYVFPPSCCAECPFAIPPSYPFSLPPHPQATTDVLSLWISFPFLVFPMHLYFLLYFFTQHNYFVFIHVISCINSMFLFITE